LKEGLGFWSNAATFMPNPSDTLSLIDDATGLREVDHKRCEGPDSLRQPSRPLGECGCARLPKTVFRRSEIVERWTLLILTNRKARGLNFI